MFPKVNKEHDNVDVVIVPLKNDSIRFNDRKSVVKIASLNEIRDILQNELKKQLNSSKMLMNSKKIWLKANLVKFSRAFFA